MPIDWDRVKPVIYNLYVTQKRSLREVKQSLSKNPHGFKASTRSYRGKLKEWGFIRRQDMVNRLSQDEHALQSGTQIPSAGHLMSDMTFQPSPFPSSSSDGDIWLPPLSDYGLVQIRQLPTNFGNLEQGHHNFTDGLTPGQDHSTPFGLVTSPQPSISLDNLDETGRTSLHHAVIRRSLEDVERQLALGSSPNIPDREGVYPLHSASQKGWIDIVRLLLKRGANAKARNKTGQTPLHLAIMFPKVVKALLASHPEVSSLDDNRNSPVHLAILATSFDVPPKNTTIDQLIHAAADLNVQNNEGKTPFELILGPVASKDKYHSQYVALFLENGADITLPTSTGKLPFELFVENVFDRLVRVDYTMDSKMRNLDFKIFITKGANFEINLAPGVALFKDLVRRCLHAPRYDYKLVQLLCEKVSVNTPDAQGEYPIHYFFQPSYGAGTRECLEILIRRGARIDQKTQDGETPLTMNLGQKSSHILENTRLLLKYCADPMLPNSKGELPIQIAARMEGQWFRDARNNVVKLLLDAFHSDSRSNGFDWNQQVPCLTWWRDVLEFLHTAWTYPTHLKDASKNLPPTDAEYLTNTVLSYGAVKHLESSKAAFEHLKETKGLNHEETKKESSQIIRILRDCDKHNIKIDESWYRYLYPYLLDLQVLS